MMGILSINEINHLATLGTPKITISIFIGSGIEVLIRNESMTSKKHNTKDCLKSYC